MICHLARTTAMLILLCDSAAAADLTETLHSPCTAPDARPGETERSHCMIEVFACSGSNTGGRLKYPIPRGSANMVKAIGLSAPMETDVEIAVTAQRLTHLQIRSQKARPIR
jgi:hypothetical protein